MELQKAEKQKKQKKYFKLGKSEWGLIVVYLAVVLLCLILSETFTKGAGINLRDLEKGDLINIGMFSIILVILGSVIINEFIPLNGIIYSLNECSERIKNEYKDNKELWDIYKCKEGIFNNDILDQEYKMFKEEIDVLENKYKDKYSCNIEDYVNDGLIDKILKKNVINLVPGTMTGLGILGTFIGLTVGLQSFSTGSAEEISNSIAPLMDGIKVAFHTSIYGMIYSLIFNYIFKEKFHDAYIAIDEFIDTYNKFVLPDFENIRDDIYISIQKEQSKAICDLSQNLGKDISTEMSKVMMPYFDKLNEAVLKVGNIAKETQTEALQKIVADFMTQMNSALGNSFKELENTITQICNYQKDNAENLTKLMGEIKGITNTTKQINGESKKIIEKFSNYISSIDELQTSICNCISEVSEQIADNHEITMQQQKYMEELVTCEKQFTDVANQLSDDMLKQVEAMKNIENEISQNTLNNIEQISQNMKKNMDELSEKAQAVSTAIAINAEEINNRIGSVAEKQINNIIELTNGVTNDLDRASKELANIFTRFETSLATSLKGTFKSFDDNLASITSHLSGTIHEVQSTTENVPRVVSDAYEGMEKIFKDLQKKLSHHTNNLNNGYQKHAKGVTASE